MLKTPPVNSLRLLIMIRLLNHSQRLLNWLLNQITSLFVSVHQGRSRVCNGKMKAEMSCLISLVVYSGLPPFGLFPFALGNNGSSTFYCSSVSFMPDYHRLTHLTIAGVLF